MSGWVHYSRNFWLPLHEQLDFFTSKKKQPFTVEAENTKVSLLHRVMPKFGETSQKMFLLYKNYDTQGQASPPAPFSLTLYTGI